MKSTKYFWSVAIFGMLWLAVVSFHSTPGDSPRISTPAKPASAQRPEAAKLEVMNAYGKLPLRFEANQGQTHLQVKFLSHGSGYALYLTPTEAVLSLRESVPSEDRATETLRGMSKHISPEKVTPRARPLPIPKSTVLRVQLLGANPAPHVSGLEELPGKSNYFIGNDPKQWRTNIPTYSRVRYREVYPGVDLVYYGNQRQLEHDFIVAPGADPRVITLGFHGADKLELDARGDLVLHIGEGEVRLLKPSVYQEVEGAKRPIAGGYQLRAKHQVGFEVTAYDESKALVIDPVLAYSTYLGGSAGDSATSIAVDSSGNAYVTGYTQSTNFPTTPSSLLPNTPGATCPGLNVATGTLGIPCYHAFVTKLNAAGSTLLYSTYLGGSGNDVGVAIAVDSSGNAYVTGHTDSTNFPTTGGAVQTALGGCCGGTDALVAKLGPAGNALVYSTYLGGSGIDYGFGIAVDSSGNAYVTGSTASYDFPTTSGAFQTTLGYGGDAFVTVLNPSGSGFIYSTFLGGNYSDGGFGIAVDSFGNAYVTGYTESVNFPTVNPFQASCSLSPYGAYCNGGDAFVTKLNATGKALVYSTYLGGSNGGYGYGIAVDSSGNAYVTGATYSTNFPTTAGAFQTRYAGGGADAFVTKLDATGSKLVYSTFLGGTGYEEGHGIAVDSSGEAHVTGFTSSTNFPAASPLQRPYGGGPEDAFVTKLNVAGSALVYSTYLGGSADDAGLGIAVDSSGNAYVTGFTSSTDFPTANAFQAANGGGYDAFVAKIRPATPPSPGHR